MLKRLYRIILTIASLLSTSYLWAQQHSHGFEHGNNQYLMRESAISDVNKSPSVKPVTIGIEIGTSIDMSGNNRSSFDLDFQGGYHSQLIKCLGLGIGYRTAFSENRYHIPIYAIFRSNLSSKEQLFFVDLRAGYSMNHLQHATSQGGFYGSAGVGINLAVSQQFRSHILLGYNFYQVSPYTAQTGIAYNETGNHLISVKLGISF